MLLADWDPSYGLEVYAVTEIDESAGYWEDDEGNGAASQHPDAWDTLWDADTGVLHGYPSWDTDEPADFDPAHTECEPSGW